MRTTSHTIESASDPLQVYCLDNGAADIRNLAERWQLPVTKEPVDMVVLTYMDRRLVLQDLRDRHLRPLWVELGVNARMMPDKKDPIFRALGRNCHVVVDATTGWGVDAAGLLQRGFQVLMMERNPVMLALLQDGMERLGARRRSAIELVAGNAISLLSRLEGDCGRDVDVIYIDTMYPETGRSRALPRRELVLLRELVGCDADATRLLSVARRVAKQRVVVKRPHYSPPIDGASVDVVYRSKLLRYDVYVSPQTLDRVSTTSKKIEVT